VSTCITVSEVNSACQAFRVKLQNKTKHKRECAVRRMKKDEKEYHAAAKTRHFQSFNTNLQH